jgi:tryptophan aminotransferase
LYAWELLALSAERSQQLITLRRIAVVLAHSDSLRNHACGMEIKAKSKKVLDLEPHISARAKLWRASQIRSFFPLEHTPGVVSLLAGKPNPETFPFEAITLSVKSLLPDDGAYDIRIDGSDLDRALQYGMTGGLPDFVEVSLSRKYRLPLTDNSKQWLEGFQTHVHGNSKEEEGWQVVVGNGSQDLLTKVRW